MKKLLTVLVLFLTLLFFKGYAQPFPTVCNPTFSFQFLSGSTVKFNPAITTDSPFVQHYWRFGDGTPASNNISPVHVYAVGVYNVTHIIARYNPNGVGLCVDSLVKQVTIGQTVCTLVAAFTSTSPAPLQVVFNNSSAGFSPGDSIRWNFGDGSVSYNANPTHQYANAGTYTVCLRVKKASTTASTTNCVSEVCHTITVTAPPATCNLAADFTWVHNSTAISLYTFQFTNTSTGAAVTDSVKWTFGDGTSSNQNNPVHIYPAAGAYNVCIRIIKRSSTGALTNCIKEKCYTIIIPVANPCNLQVFFITTTIQPNVIGFSNQSSGYTSSDSLTWNFGDGTVSHAVNPTHTYALPGTYNVCLVIKKNTIAGTSPCIRSFCKTIVIANTCTLLANFTYYRDSTAPNLYTYHFNNTSAPLSNTDSIRWTFGDGTSSNQLNPTHSFNAPAVFNVCLRIIKRNANGVLTNCVGEKCFTIIIMPACTLQANYTRTVSATNYKTINFTNTSNATPNTATATWYFGDGTTATTWNATHAYNFPGSYYVCLRMQSGLCVSYKCDSVRITAPTPACIAQSAYSYVRSATNNNIITFTPDYISNDIQYTWTFGDGTGTQTAVTPTHQFASIGYYTVCLTAFKNNNCASTTCKTIYVSSTTNCSAITLNFSDVRDPLVPNRVTFAATSNTVITDQLWTIKKLPATSATGTATIHANNPTYVFLDSGYYNVCLRTTYAGGCVKELCRIIHITQQMPLITTCNLQVYPNPATNYANANITLAAPTMLYAYVYNSMNMLVAQKQQQGFVGINTVSISTGNLPSGIYHFRLVHGNGVCNATFVK